MECDRHGCNTEMIPYIDYALCVGCGACAELYPAYFVLRDGQAWLVGHMQFDPELTEDVINSCIYGAISVEGPDGEGISHGAPAARGRWGRRGR